MANFVLASDLEGVLIPEIWPALGKSLHIPELSLTTREVSDMNVLMKIRLGVLKRDGVEFPDIIKHLSAVKPFEGAEEFMSKVSKLRNVSPVIISDSFEQFVDVVLKKRYGWKVFVNKFDVSFGRLEGCKLEVGGKKDIILSKINRSGRKTIAVGDSFNDVGMLKLVTSPILFNPVPALQKAFYKAIVCKDFAGLFDVIQKITSEKT